MDHPPHCYLLDISVELRKRIYAELLPRMEKVTITTFLGDSFSDSHEDEAAVERIPVHAQKYGGYQAHHTSILQTCRQIHAEAEPLLYTTASLLLMPATDPWPRWGKEFDVRKLQSFRIVQKLRIHFMDLHMNHDDTVATQTEHCDLLRQFLSPKLAVTSLEIEFADQPLSHRLEMVMEHVSACLKAVGKTEVTVVHLRLKRGAHTSRRLIHAGEWKDCNCLGELLKTEDEILQWRARTRDQHDAQCDRIFDDIKSIIRGFGKQCDDVEPGGPAEDDQRAVGVGSCRSRVGQRGLNHG